MNGLDFLAWLILGCFAVFMALPALFSSFVDSYWESVCLGVGCIVVIVIAAAVVLAVIWAIDRVLA